MESILFITATISAIWATYAKAKIFLNEKWPLMKAILFGHGQTLKAIFTNAYMKKSSKWVYQLRIAFGIFILCILLMMNQQFF